MERQAEAKKTCTEKQPERQREAETVRDIMKEIRSKEETKGGR